MTALRKILIEEETVFTAPVSRAPAKLYVVTNTATPAVEERSATKNIALFFLAPFIGLAYMLLFPLAGLVALAVLAGRAAAKYEAVRVTATVRRMSGWQLRPRCLASPTSSSSPSSASAHWPGSVAGRS